MELPALLALQVLNRRPSLSALRAFRLRTPNSCDCTVHIVGQRRKWGDKQSYRSTAGAGFDSLSETKHGSQSLEQGVQVMRTTVGSFLRIQIMLFILFAPLVLWSQ